VSLRWQKNVVPRMALMGETKIVPFLIGLVRFSDTAAIYYMPEAWSTLFSNPGQGPIQFAAYFTN